MRIRAALVAPALLALAACHRQPSGDVQPGEEAAAQARTSAKALADIAAAEEAARAPLAEDTTPPPPRAAPKPKRAVPDESEDAPPVENEASPQ